TRSGDFARESLAGDLEDVLHRSATLAVQYTYGAVVADGRQVPAVGRECDLWPLLAGQQGSCRREGRLPVINVHRFVAGGGEVAAVRCERNAGQGLFAGAQGGRRRAAVLPVVHTNGAVLARAGHIAAAGREGHPRRTFSEDAQSPRRRVAGV